MLLLPLFLVNSWLEEIHGSDSYLTVPARFVTVPARFVTVPAWFVTVPAWFLTVLNASLLRMGPSVKEGT